MDLMIWFKCVIRGYHACNFFLCRFICNLRGVALYIKRNLGNNVFPRFFFGACDRIRTCDPFITNELLYRLSHTSIDIQF